MKPVEGQLTEKWEMLDRLIGLFGEGDTGKTTLIYHFMELFSGLIEVCTIFTRSPKSYPTIPPPFIYDGITKRGVEQLEAIWDLQNARTKIFDRANDIKTLRAAYDFCLKNKRPGINETNKHLKILSAEERKIPESEKDEVFKEKIKRMRMIIYKNLIEGNRSWLMKPSTKCHPDIKHAADYVRYNHRHLLIFDDVTADLKKAQKHEVFKNLFYAARHRGITMLMITHDDKVFDTEIRKNMHFAIFTCPSALAAFFSRTSMNFSPEIKKQAAMIAADEDTFAHYHKIVYKKKSLHNHFKRFRVPKREGDNITFGDPQWKELGKLAAAPSEGATERERKFYHDILK